MNIRFLNPFVESAYEVIAVETGIKMQRGELNLLHSDYITNDVTVIISLVGDVEGNVFYSMNQQTAVALASSMLSEHIDSFDSLAQSGIAELGNVITGRASIKLSEAGFEANISPPTLLTGSGAIISTLDFQRLVVPMDSELGRIEIHLALRQSVSTGKKASEIATPPSPLPN